MELGFITNKTAADVELARAIGYTNVELFFSVRDQDPVDFPERKEFVRALADGPITVSAIALHSDELPICGDPDMQALSSDRFKAALDIACQVDAGVLYTGTGTDLTGTGLHPEEDQEEVARRIVDTFMPRLEQATAAIARHGDKFDPSHAAQDDRSYLAEAEDWAGSFVHVHAKDVMQIGDRFHADPNPGFGQIQWGLLFALFYEADYPGSVTVEPHSDMWANRRREAGLRASFRYLSQFLLD